VLEVLAVLGDQGGCEAGQGLADFGNELCAHQVLYGLLGVGVGVVFNLELVGFTWLVLQIALATGMGQVNIRRTHLPRYRGLPQEC
jgi:hypothetical protein